MPPGKENDPLGSGQIHPSLDQWDPSLLCDESDAKQHSIAVAKDRSSSPIYQTETGRSLSAQLALTVEYIHARGLTHGGY